MAVELYPHQKKAMEELHNGSILKGGVGTGKSITALAYFYTKECGGVIPVQGAVDWTPPQTSKDIYVITTAKKRDGLDWEKESVGFGISTQRDLSIGGIQLTVDSWNNIPAYSDIKDAFFVFDEQRLVGSGAWTKAFIKIAKNNRWIMLSATPGDTWMDYIPVFVANGFYKNRTDFIHSHVVYNTYSTFAKVDHYVQTAELERLRKRVLVEMPYNRHTTRHVEQIVVDYDKELFERVFKDRWHVYEDRPIKDVGELFSVMRKVVNLDPSRQGEFMKILEKHQRVIVFYNFNYELDALRVLTSNLGVETAEWNGQKHQEIPESDKWIYLVQYTAGAEGWNCIATNAMLYYSLNYSWKINEQGKGRIDRINTPFFDLYYYVFRSMSYIDTSIMKALTTKQNFNGEKSFKW